MIRQLAPLACLLAASTTAAAQTPARPCISPAENEALVAYVMPELVDALEQRCASALPAQPFLGTRSGALKARLAPQAERAWPVRVCRWTGLSKASPRLRSHPPPQP